MLPLLVWLAGIVFGFWTIWHWNFLHEAWAFSVCAAVFCWIVGGAGWIGRKLQAGAAAPVEVDRRGRVGPPIVLTDQDREALKRSAAAHPNDSLNP